MSDNNNTQQPQPQRPTSPEPLTEEKGLPPVDYSPPTPPVKPPKKNK